MEKFFFRQCADCQEPTKKVTGFWVGVNPVTREGTHGCSYDCENLECPVKQFAVASEIEADNQREECRKINRKNGVDIPKLRAARIAARCTMRDGYHIVGVEPHMYSDWEHERKPMDKEIYEILMAYFTEE